MGEHTWAHKKNVKMVYLAEGIDGSAGIVAVLTLPKPRVRVPVHAVILLVGVQVVPACTNIWDNPITVKQPFHHFTMSDEGTHLGTDPTSDKGNVVVKSARVRLKWGTAYPASFRRTIALVAGLPPVVNFTGGMPNEGSVISRVFFCNRSSLRHL